MEKGEAPSSCAPTDTNKLCMDCAEVLGGAPLKCLHCKELQDAKVLGGVDEAADGCYHSLWRER